VKWGASRCRGNRQRQNLTLTLTLACPTCVSLAQMLAGGFGGAARDDEGAVLHYAAAAAAGDVNALLAMGYRHSHG
jgi:TPR repeat protein